MAQIQHTVHHVPKVMMKVTGAGTKVGAVAAHCAYTSRQGELTVETDEGDRSANRDSQKALFKDSQRARIGPSDGYSTARRPKLVHNIVLSIPSSTPPKRC